MKSAVFLGKQNIQVMERELPELGSDEVLIKVMACGVCGSDVHIYEMCIRDRAYAGGHV